MKQRKQSQSSFYKKIKDRISTLFNQQVYNISETLQNLTLLTSFLIQSKQSSVAVNQADNKYNQPNFIFFDEKNQTIEQKYEYQWGWMNKTEEKQCVSESSLIVQLISYHHNKYIQMAQNEEKTDHSKPELCYKCKEMYGNALFDNMCSLCFKKEKQIENNMNKNEHLSTPDQKCQVEEIKVEPLSLKREFVMEEPEQKEENKTKRCQKCSKKTGMLGFECKHCSNQFCKMHRLPEDHDCEVDFVTLGRKKIKMDNPTISVKKIEHI